MDGSGSGTPREGSVSPHPPPQCAPAADGHSELEIVVNGAPSSSLTSSLSGRKGKDHNKEQMGLRRAVRQLSLNRPMFGLGLGLGGREKDQETESVCDVGKKDGGKKLYKMRMPDTALSSSSPALANATQ